MARTQILSTAHTSTLEMASGMTASVGVTRINLVEPLRPPSDRSETGSESERKDKDRLATWSLREKQDAEALQQQEKKRDVSHVTHSSCSGSNHGVTVHWDDWQQEHTLFTGGRALCRRVLLQCMRDTCFIGTNIQVQKRRTRPVVFCPLTPRIILLVHCAHTPTSAAIPLRKQDFCDANNKHCWHSPLLGGFLSFSIFWLWCEQNTSSPCSHTHLSFLGYFSLARHLVILLSLSIYVGNWLKVRLLFELCVSTGVNVVVSHRTTCVCHARRHQFADLSNLLRNVRNSAFPGNCSHPCVRARSNFSMTFPARTRCSL